MLGRLGARVPVRRSGNLRTRLIDPAAADHQVVIVAGETGSGKTTQLPKILLELGRERLGVDLDPFDDGRLVYPWRHPDLRVDRLQDTVAGVVGRRLTASRSAVFDELLSLAAEQVGAPVSRRAVGARDRATVAYLNEPWYC